MTSAAPHTFNEQAPYSPGALMTAFSNSVSSPLLNIPLRIKGIYQQGKGVNYSGMYYDVIKDEFSTTAITLVVPERLRLPMQDGQLIDAHGYLAKRVSAATSRIDLLLTLTEIVSRKEKVVNEEEQRALALIQQKANHGYKDVDHLIREKLYQQVPIKVLMIIGSTAIIDQDIMHQMKDVVHVYIIHYKRVNLTRVAEIIQAMEDSAGMDILVISRGGGDNIQVFDSLELANHAIDLKPALITAIGHAADVPLLQKVADKHFITPTALGQYFYDMYTRTVEELNDSKAKLITDLTKQIELNYQTKIQVLSDQASGMLRILDENRNEFQRREKEVEAQLERSKRMNTIMVILLIATILGMAISFALHK